jgi:hypothetical protein
MPSGNGAVSNPEVVTCSYCPHPPHTGHCPVPYCSCVQAPEGATRSQSTLKAKEVLNVR